MLPSGFYGDSDGVSKTLDLGADLLTCIVRGSGLESEATSLAEKGPLWHRPSRHESGEKETIAVTFGIAVGS
jgi:hypothetical protein